MKGKRVYIFLILFLFAGLPYAFSQGISLEALPVSNGIVEVHNNESFQTVYTKSGIGLTVGAKAVDSAIRYDFEIINDTNKDFFFDLDSVEAYGGNHKKHKWTPYIIYDSPAALPVTSSTDNSSKDEDDAALAKGIVAGVAIVAVTVGAFLLFDKLRDSNDSDISISPSSSKKEKDKKSETYKKPPRKHRPEYRPYPHHHDIVDDILFWSFIDSIENKSNASNDLSVNSLNSKRIRAGDKFFGSFYVLTVSLLIRFLTDSILNLSF